MKRNKGFTLLEIMIAVAIIAIIFAALSPVFLGMRRTAQIRAAQSEVDATAAAYIAFYGDHPGSPNNPRQILPSQLVQSGYLEAGHDIDNRVGVVRRALVGDRYWVIHKKQILKTNSSVLRNNEIVRDIGLMSDFKAN